MKDRHICPRIITVIARLTVTLAAILIPLTSCDMLASALTGEEQVTVILPGPPHAAVLAGLREPLWTVSWYDADAIRQEQTVRGNRCSIILTKGECTPVLAELRSTDPRIGPFPPAGSIYPALAEASRDTVTLKASWHGGVAAHTTRMAFDAADGGPATARIIVSRFNWKRLLAELEKLEHPEYIDYGRLVGALLSGRVRIYDIRVLPLVAVRLELPEGTVAPGSVFFPAWPGHAEFIWNASNTLSLEMPRTMTRFYSQAGCITVFPAYPPAERTIFTPYSLQD